MKSFVVDTDEHRHSGGSRNRVLLKTAGSAGARSMGLLQQVAGSLGVGVRHLGDDDACDLASAETQSTLVESAAFWLKSSTLFTACS